MPLYLNMNLKHWMIKWMYMAIDFVAVAGAIYLACWIREDTIAAPVTVYGLFFDATNPFQILFVLWIVTTILCANANRLYETQREMFEGFELLKTAKCVLLASVVVVVTSFVLKIDHFPRLLLVLGIVFNLLFLSLWRLFKRLFVFYLVAQGYNNFNVLVIGAGRVGTLLVNEIRQHRSLGLRVVGYLDDFKPLGSVHDGVAVMGTLADLSLIAPQYFVSKIFITIQHDSSVFMRLIEQAKRLGIAVRVIPQGFDLTTGRLLRYNIGFIPVLEYCDQERHRQQMGKRVFDLVFGSLTLIGTLPLMIFIAAAIKLDSPGPVFYRSRRYSRRGQMFGMLKFRSMICDADRQLETLRHRNEVDGPIFKMKKDPRVTRVGRFLRRYSLDELPQLLNVLKGDMSLVGPRPLPIEQIEREDLRQLKRLEVRPGITGLWQVRGRSDVSFGRLLKWDLWYINNWSFMLDLNVLVQTIPVIFRGRGAY